MKIVGNRKIIILSALLVTSLLFGGCLVAKPADLSTESPDVTLSGTLVQAGTRFSLNISGKPPIELDSRQVNLTDYAGKTVTVTGQYSGTTLFVSKIQ